MTVEASAVRQLDACLRRFVDAAMAGDDQGALTAFADAQSLPALRAVGVEAQLWAELEQQVAGLVDLEALEGVRDRQQVAAWTRCRNQARQAADSAPVDPDRVGIVPSEAAFR